MQSNLRKLPAAWPLAIFLLFPGLTRAETPVQAWVQTYNGPDHNDDWAVAVAVDGNNNVIVKGWADSDPNYPRVNYDYLTIKYSSEGVPLWTNRYNGPGNDWDQPSGIAVDGNNDVIVTGYTMGSGSSYDATTIKYLSAGVPLWTNRYNGPANGNDYAHALAVDRSNNVIVAGYSAVNLNTADYLMIKYSSAGVPLWTKRYRGPGNGVDAANAVTVDSSNNILVTGNSYRSGSDFDYATVKYSSAGVPLWTNRYNGPGNATDQAFAVAVDADGRVFVTGYSTGSGIIFDYATVAISSGGTSLWTKRYNAGGDDAKAASLRLDREGNVVVTGSARTSAKASDIATISYASYGTPLWTNRYNGPASGEDKPYGKGALSVGLDEAVYVVGGSDGDYDPSITMEDFVLVKYSASATLAVRLLPGELELSWPASFMGVQLQQQTNSASKGLSTNWVTVPWSTLTNRLWRTTASDCGFFRLFNP